MKLCIGTATFEIFVTSGHLLTENLLSWFFGRSITQVIETATSNHVITLSVSLIQLLNI